MQGQAVVEFAHLIEFCDRGWVFSQIREYRLPISLNRAFYNRNFWKEPHLWANLDLPSKTKISQLTHRQLGALKGLVAGESNAQIAKSPSYSTSTFGHEIMKIYGLLAVTDRCEAAKKVVELTLVKLPDTLKPSISTLTLSIQ